MRYTIALLLICWSVGHTRAASSQDFTYTLKSGESIWSVSQALLEVSRNWIKLQKYNNVGEEGARSLAPGAQIRIPLNWLKREDLPVEVISVSGTAHLYAAKSTQAQAVAAGNTLRTGDRVSTQGQSFLELRLPEGSQLQVAPMSEFVVLAQRYFGTSITRVEFTVIRGRIETQVKARTDPGSRYEIITPTAQLGVRGTQFRVSVGEKNAIAEVEEGKVAVNNPTLTRSALVELDKGFGTIVREGQAPLPPIALLPAPDLSGLVGAQQGVDLEYAFSPVAGAIAYRVRLTRAPPSRDVLVERVTTMAILKLFGLPSGVYHLRVRAIDGHGIEGYEAQLPLELRELQL